ncbi:glycosyltransferase family 2 protein [Candidatus Woesearchaeota archaeon]|nr:glycosyltransferase family 2 protein [Candidatus Woesearchaeota archaeon]
MWKSLSVVIPVYNEEENILPMYTEVSGVLQKLKIPYELIFVDDGSKDQTYSFLHKLHQRDKRIKVIRFRKNFGQTAALDAGLRFAHGEVIVTMDGDLQNDPTSIPFLLNKLAEGYDAVSGWRYQRRDTLAKKMYSKLANMLRKKLLGETIHDAGCSLKVYRREAVQGLELYGQMHRYIISLVGLKGFKIGEVKVGHRARIHGKTKYNFKRLLRGLLDLFFIKYLAGYSTRPLHFFGLLGFLQYGLAFLIFLEQVIKALYLGFLTVGPLLILIVLLFMTGTITIIFGFLAEILVRIRYQDVRPYNIQTVLE